MNAAVMNPQANWQAVAALADFGAERRLKREIDGLSVLLFRTQGEIIAIHNHCTHLGKPLENGRLMAGQLSCPFHNACFELRTGKALSGPAVMPLHVFPLRIVDDRIEIDLARRPAHLLRSQP